MNKRGRKGEGKKERRRERERERGREKGNSHVGIMAVGTATASFHNTK